MTRLRRLKNLGRNADNYGMQRVLGVVAVAVVIVMASSGVGAQAKPKKPPPPAEQGAQAGDAEDLANIASILATAEAAMKSAADDFMASAPSARSQDEFDLMQNIARGRISVSKGIADSQLRRIRDEARPGPVHDAAVVALQPPFRGRAKRMIILPASAKIRS